MRVSGMVMRDQKKIDQKKLLILLALGVVLLLSTSCGTILGGGVQACQKRKPNIEHREIRPFALAGDLLMAPIALPIDFYTGAIYKPCIHYTTETINKKEVRRVYNNR